MLRDTWKFELEIVCYIIPDPGAFEKAMEGPFLIFGNKYCPHCRKRALRSPRGIALLAINQGRETSMISLALHVVNLEAGCQRRQEGASTSKVERCSHGRH